MSYKKDKYEMNGEMDLHKKRVIFIIKVTFIALAVSLFALAISLTVNLLQGGLFGAARDTVPPTIEPMQGKTVIGYVGEKPTYKKYVSVTDDKDEDPQFDVNASGVDINTPGTYTVFYKAVDKAGNKSETFKLTYVVKSDEYSEKKLMALVAELAEELGITQSMSTVEKVKAIYKFVNLDHNITWSTASALGDSNIPNIDRDNWKEDWVEEAIRTINLYNDGDGEGDCYSYYAVSKAFFEYFDIKHVGIRRDKSLDYEEDINGNRKGTHFWLIVDIGGGQWYYYDGTRLGSTFNDGTKNACLITQEKLDSYVIKKTGGTYFYQIRKVDECLDFSSAGISSFPKIATKVIN